MRNFTQVETHEIADSDLDNISGGVSISGGGGIGFVGFSGGVAVDGLGEVVGAAESALPGSPVSGNVSF
jgi:hypothetical protein